MYPKNDFSSEFAEWDILQGQLIKLFKENNNGRTDLMERGIILLEQIVVNVNQAKPINFSERFDFIIKNKNNYAAFRQLDELFKETKKKLARLRVQLKDK